LSPPIRQFNINWPDNIDEAKAVQAALKDSVRIVSLGKKPRTIAGVDAAFFGEKVIAVASLYKYPDLINLEDAFAILMCPFPYIPGFLSFREGPAIIEALYGLKSTPDVILVDGQGIAHPKKLGIASHIGALLDMSTIGCAKSRLVGEYKEPKPRRGSRSALKYNGEVVGSVLRTRENVKPLFVSPGHRVDLEDSVRLVLGCARQFRIPEPLRRADFLSKKLKREI
jgi:deoxyribonuclease V